jgi:hypothetical protein
MESKIQTSGQEGNQESTNGIIMHTNCSCPTCVPAKYGLSSLTFMCSKCGANTGGAFMMHDGMIVCQLCSGGVNLPSVQSYPMMNTGAWICPRCQAVNAPHSLQCTCRPYASSNVSQWSADSSVPNAIMTTITNESITINGSKFNG